MTFNWQQIQRAQQAAQRAQQSIDWQHIRRAQQVAQRAQRSVDLQQIQRATETWERAARHIDWQQLQQLQQSHRKAYEALEGARRTVDQQRQQTTLSGADWEQLRGSIEFALENFENIQKIFDWEELAEAARILCAAQESEDKWQLMREALKKKTEGELSALSRTDVEDIGTRLDLAPDEAVELFESHKDISWRGDYISSDESSWIGVWIEEIY